MKVTVVGAGNVGATVANVVALKKFASEVVLIDIKEGVSEGKAMDMMQCSHALGFDTTVKGVTNDYAATANSDVIVVTSGLPRKPGMTREELVGVNAKIVKSVVEQALKHSPNAIFIIISNPMDADWWGLVLPELVGCNGHRLDEWRRHLVLPDRQWSDGDRMALRQRLLVLPGCNERRDGNRMVPGRDRLVLQQFLRRYDDRLAERWERVVLPE